MWLELLLLCSVFSPTTLETACSMSLVSLLLCRGRCSLQVHGSHGLVFAVCKGQSAEKMCGSNSSCCAVSSVRPLSRQHAPCHLCLCSCAGAGALSRCMAHMLLCLQCPRFRKRRHSRVTAVSSTPSLPSCARFCLCAR